MATDGWSESVRRPAPAGRLVRDPLPRARRPSLHIEKIVERLGAMCVPLLGRELCSPSEPRRDAARAALAQLATTNRSVRPRVIAELRAITEGTASDDGKVCALGLLGELGERGAARSFTIRTRSNAPPPRRSPPNSRPPPTSRRPPT